MSIIKEKVIFYDGECALCHSFVSFALKRDRLGGNFHFAPLQGITFAQIKEEHDLENVPSTVIFYNGEGEFIFRSKAVLAVLMRLGGVYASVAGILSWVPQFISDFVYDLVAAYRKKIFGKAEGLCPMIPPELRDRFYP